MRNKYEHSRQWWPEWKAYTDGMDDYEYMGMLG